MDKGYDIEALYAACEDRQVRPIMPLRLTPAVTAGADAVLGTRPLAVRRIGLQPEGFQVALPDRRVQARLTVDQGQPYSPAGPA